MLPPDTRLLADPPAVAAEACRLIGEAAQDAIRQRGEFRLVLAGGTTPRLAYERLAGTAQDWSKWQVFFGDERCLPADHADRNSRMAEAAWLERVAIPPAQIHAIAAEHGAARAAADYARTLNGRRPFDLVLLGMGEDGHTASLFPGPVAGHGAAEASAGGVANAGASAGSSAVSQVGANAASHADDALVIPVLDAPKPPAERVSLSYTALRDSRRQLVLVTGAGKAAALAAWRAGAALPIARAVRDDACLLVDRAAWAG